MAAQRLTSRPKIPAQFDSARPGRICVAFSKTRSTGADQIVIANRGRHVLDRVLRKTSRRFAREQRVRSFGERINIGGRSQMLTTGGNEAEIQGTGLDQRIVFRRGVDVCADASDGAFRCCETRDAEVGNLYDLRGRQLAEDFAV